MKSNLLFTCLVLFLLAGCQSVPVEARPAPLTQPPAVPSITVPTAQLSPPVSTLANTPGASLAPISDDRSVEELIQILYASYPGLPQYDPTSAQYAAFPQALKQLEAMGPRAIDAASHIAITIGSSREDAYLAAQTLLSLGPDITRLTLPILIDLLQSGRPEARMNAALLIGTGGEASSCAAGQLGPLLWDPNPQVRYAAAFALEKVTGEDLIPDNHMTLPDPLLRASIPEDSPEGVLVAQARTWWTEKGSAVNWHPSYGACDP